VRPLQFRGRTCWNLYYRLAPEVWGMGLAVEAACEAVAVAEALHPDWPVLARTRPANGPAVRVAEGAGLTQRSDLDAGGFVVAGSPRSTADRSTTGSQTRCVWHERAETCGRAIHPGGSSEFSGSRPRPSGRLRQR